MIELLGRKEHRQFLGVPLGAIHAQALQFQRLHCGNIQTDGEGQLRGMHAKGELRGHLGWNGDIIQPWCHRRHVAIAVKRLGRHTMNDFVIVVI